jgi:hypothetical protein
MANHPGTAVKNTTRLGRAVGRPRQPGPVRPPALAILLHKTAASGPEVLEVLGRGGMLKPANILLARNPTADHTDQEQKEVGPCSAVDAPSSLLRAHPCDPRFNGIPKITDFGLAKQLETCHIMKRPTLGNQGATSA